MMKLLKNFKHILIVISEGIKLFKVYKVGKMK